MCLGVCVCVYVCVCVCVLDNPVGKCLLCCVCTAACEIIVFLPSILGRRKLFYRDFSRSLCLHQERCFPVSLSGV